MASRRLFPETILGLLPTSVARPAEKIIDGVEEILFGPGQPPSLNVPEAGPPQDRRTDYDAHFNLRRQHTVRDSGVTHEQLRALSDMHDVTRSCLETRKDQIARLKWDIRDRESKKTTGIDSESIVQALRYPDKEHSWAQWISAILEDYFVLDAVTIQPRKTRGGDAFSLELMDGSTIVRKIDGFGREPQNGQVAYQQVIKGLVMAEFSADELIYVPRNYRTHKHYGYSVLEQIIVTVNTAIRRQQYTLQYFTEGNIPEALIGVPETWGVDEIKQFQGFWDLVMEGDGAAKRHAKFVPGGTQYIATKEPELSGRVEEWLARVVCFAFSLPPTPFIQQNNRATAESSRIESLEQGIEPTKVYLKDIMDRILERHFGRPDLEHVWRYESSLNRLEQAQIQQVQVSSNIITPDEARAEIGLPPLTDEQKKELERIATQGKDLQSGPSAPKPSRAKPQDSTA